MRLFFLTLALLALTSCSSPAPKTEKKAEPPPEPVGAQKAFFKTYPSARTWSSDVMALQVESLAIPEVKPVDGKFGAWKITYVSPAKGPDASWFPAEQCTPASDIAGFTGLPAIVVEVLSPSTRSFDLLRKRGDYERLGVQEFWVFDPVDTSALVMRLDGDRYTEVPLAPADELTSPLLPGFAVGVGSLFVR